MEVNPGFKQSEVGVIPEDWDIVLLEQYAHVRSGIAKNSNIKLSDPIRVHYLRVANVQDGFLDLTEMSEISIERSDLRRFSVVAGDVLMNEGGDRDKLGRGCIWSGQYNPCVHQNHVFVVRCAPKLHSHYLTAWTRSWAAKQYFINAGSQTTNLASINKLALGKLPIALPPTKIEQEEIARALSDADAFIESLELLVAKQHLIKHGAMQELLTGQKRLPGFAKVTGYQQTEIGAIPNEWTLTPLGRLVRTVEYGSSAKSAMKGTIPVLRMGNLQGGKIDWSDLVYTDNAAEISKYSLRKGDVLFNRTNTIDLVGKTSIYEGEQPAIFAGYLIRINVLPDLLDSRFLNYMLNTEFARKHSTKILSVAVGQANINGQKLKTYPIPLPPTKEEQASIAEVLSDMDTEIASLEAKLVKARQVKQGMMQELLTGRTRLV